jgi:hypothetical protein
VCSVALALVLAGPALFGADVVMEMTPEAVSDAISAGLERPPKPYPLNSPKVWMLLETPFLRVAMAAAKAQSQNMAIDGSLITPDMTAPVLKVLAGPELLGVEPIGIKSILAQADDSTPVAPTSVTKTMDIARSARKKKIELKGVNAVFPISVLKPGVRFRLVMEKGPEHVITPDAAWFAKVR